MNQISQMSDTTAPDPTSYESKMQAFQSGYDDLIKKTGNILPAPSTVPSEPVLDPGAFLRQAQQTQQDIGQWSRDPYQAGKPFAINLGDEKTGFGRYEQSGQFKKLGYDPFTNNEDLYHKNQGTFSRLGSVGANLIGKTAAYTVQTAGFLLGAPVALMANDITRMTDNFLVKASDAIKDYTQDHNPIYKGDKYTSGSIWDKLATTDWWMDDAVDRIALTASMFVPGVLEAKGIGLASLGAKALKSIAENPGEYSNIGKMFLPRLYAEATTGALESGVSPALKAYAKTLTRGELYTWNIVGQSALNAKETQAGIKKALTEQRTAGENSLSDDQIAVQAALGAKASFWETVPITLASSLYEIPQMFSTTQGAKSVLNKLYNSTTGEALLNNLKSEAPGIGKIALTAALTGFEHGQNESMQVAISRYNEDSRAGKDTRGTIPGIWGDYLDNVNDPNGQNNIALGTIQGILMTLGGKAIDYKTGKYTDETKNKQSTLDLINSQRLLRRFYQEDVTLTDEHGPLIGRDGKPITDQDKIVNGALSLAGVQQAIELKKAAIQQGHYTLAQKIDHDNLSGFSYNFFSDPSGMNHLTGILAIERDAAKTDLTWKGTDEHGNPITPDQLFAQHLGTIKELKKVYDSIDQRHAGFTDLDVDHKNKDEVIKARAFIENKKFAQYRMASNQMFFSDKLKKNQSLLSSLNIPGKTDKFDSEGKPEYSLIHKPNSPQEELYNELVSEKEPLEEALQDSKDKYRQLISKSGVREAFKDWLAFTKPVETAAKQAQAEQTAPPTQTPPPPVTPAQTASVQAAVASTVMDPVLKQRLEEALVIEDKKREADGEPPYHSLENFTSKSTLAKDIIKNFDKPVETATIAAPIIVNSDLEAKKADIEKRRQQELKQNFDYYNPQQTVGTTERNAKDQEKYDRKLELDQERETDNINDKYDAELAALSKPTQPHILSRFINKIVFMTAGIGKSTVAEKYPDQVVDGDQLLFVFLTHKQIPTSTVQKSGLDFWKYLQTHQDESDTLVKDFQDFAKKAVIGKTLLTASKYLRPIADEVYLSHNPKRVAAVFEERGQSETFKAANKHIKENRDEFAGRETIPINDQTFAEHILTGQMPQTVIAVPVDLQRKAAEISSLKKLDALSKELIEQVTKGNLTSETAEKIIQDTRKRLVTEVNFENVSQGDILVMNDKNKFKNRGLAEVVRKDDQSIKVIPWWPTAAKNPRKATEIKTEDFKDQVSLIYKDGMTPEDITPAIDPGTEKVTKMNQADMTDSEKLDQSYDQDTQGRTADDLEDNLGKDPDC